MSSGHRHNGKSLGDHEVDQALAHPSVRKALARTRRVDRSWDIPYLGGYSEDGRTIFIDRHLPKQLKSRHGYVDADRFLVLHEEVEKALIDVLGFKYGHAHEVATRAEEDAVHAAGVDLNWYRNVLKPFIKSDEHHKLFRVPTTLDLTPYKAPPVSEALLLRVRQAQRSPEGGRWIEPEDVDYSMGMAMRQCGLCAYFSKPNQCTVIRHARPQMWCEFFTKAYEPEERKHA